MAAKRPSCRMPHPRNLNTLAYVAKQTLQVQIRLRALRGGVAWVTQVASIQSLNHESGEPLAGREAGGGKPPCWLCGHREEPRPGRPWSRSSEEVDAPGSLWTDRSPAHPPAVAPRHRPPADSDHRAVR